MTNIISRDIFLLLHNIRSAHNVGSIFRTADAAGVSQIYLTGYTPKPLDRFNRPVKEISKTALGAELTMPWEYFASPNGLIKKFKMNDGEVVGVEQDVRAINYRSHKITKATLIVMGNEVLGISPSLLKQCDTILEIPMHGEKESLNVSVATGIILFQLQS